MIPPCTHRFDVLKEFDSSFDDWRTELIETPALFFSKRGWRYNALMKLFARWIEKLEEVSIAKALGVAEFTDEAA